MRLALESMHEWRTSSIFNPYYYQSGILIADDFGWGRNCLQNYKLFDEKVDCEMLSVEEAVRRFPIFKDTNWDGATQCYWNPVSGWAEADQAVSSCLESARGLGVEIIEASVETLLSTTDGEGRHVVDGAMGTDGTEYRAGNVILCTGAYTAKLLLDTFPHDEDAQLGDRMFAAGAVSCTASYDQSEKGKIVGVPVLINTMPNTHGTFDLFFLPPFFATVCLFPLEPSIR